MRIALKPVTTSPSTTDTTGASKPSGGGSFLDILIQGTQGAAQGAQPAGSQTQSDAHSPQSSSDEASSQESSGQQTAQSGATPVTASQKQPAAPATNAAGSQPSQPSAAGTSPVKTVQNLPGLLALTNLTAAGSDAATSAATAQASNSSTQVAPSGKQAGATKGTPGKQVAATSGGADANALQQAAANLQQAISVPAPAPLPTLPATLPLALVPGPSQVVSTDPTGEGKSQSSLQPYGTPAGTSANPANSAPAAANAPNAQAQQDASGTTSGESPQFLHDLAAIAANALKTGAASATPDAGNSAQASAPKSAQNADQTAATQAASSTFFSAAIALNDNVATQTASKVIPFRVGATSLGANANATGVPSTGSTSATSTNAVSATAAKNNTQDSSNSPSRDGQAGNDAALRTQTDTTLAANAVVRTDTSAQPFVLSTATAHADAQTASSTTTSDATPSHVSDARNLPADPANTSLPAAGAAINTARVIQNMNETEMRVGMRSTEFGDISIRTMVTQQQMQTQISVDHSELVSALTAHIPSVQAKLGADYGLHASIEVSQGGASFSNNQGQSSQKDYKPFTPSTQIAGTAPLADTDRMIARPAAVASPLLEGSRLDIRA